MSTYTPPPWHAEPGERVVTTQMRVISAADGLGPVAFCTKDNFDLIFAVHDLLAACQLWVKYQIAIESDDPEASRPLEAYSEAMDATFAAIAKANGVAT